MRSSFARYCSNKMGKRKNKTADEKSGNDSIDASNGVGLSDEKDQLNHEFCQLNRNINRIISLLDNKEAKSVKEEDCRAEVMEIGEKLKSFMKQDCPQLYGEMTSVSTEGLESDKENPVQFTSSQNLVYGEPSFPPFNSNNIFAIQTEAINRNPLAKIGQMVDGPGTQSDALSSMVLPLVNPELSECQVLIVEPTRELAKQTYKMVQSWSERIDSKSKITCHICVGGTSGTEDKLGLKQGPHVVIGTPGRLVNNCFRSSLDINKLKGCILNHADTLLYQDFDRRVHVILELLPLTVQLIAVRKMSTEQLAIHRKLLRHDPTIVFMKDELSLNGIVQFYVDVKNESKFKILCDILEKAKKLQCIIFCNTKRSVKQILSKFMHNQYDVAPIHTIMNQKERDEMIRIFLAGKRRILITTESYVRGFDLQDVPLIINYDLPLEKVDYISRVGWSIQNLHHPRIAVTLIKNGEEKILKEVECFFKTEIKKLPENFVSFSNEKISAASKAIEVVNKNSLDNEKEDQCQKIINDSA